MYKNQYIIVREGNKKIRRPEGFKNHSFADCTILAHEKLEVYISGSGPVKLALLGPIIDPFHPEKENAAVLKDLAGNSSTFETMLKGIQHTTGRYVLLYKDNTSLMVTGDACNRRQIFYGKQEGQEVITSSPKLFLDLFGLEPMIHPEIAGIISMDLFRKKDSSWYGDECVEGRLKKLLPNHVLDVNTQKVSRAPLFPPEIRGEKEIISYSAEILKASFEALTRRHTLIQPLTAGLDSRMLLAASKDFKDQIDYYVFQLPGTRMDDIDIPRKLSSSLGFTFEVIPSGELKEDFVTLFSKEHVDPRIIRTTANIQSHYERRYGEDVINVNGNCAEVARNAYGYTYRKVRADMLTRFSLYNNQIPYFNRQIESWLEKARPFARQYGIPVLDLFYG
jgi:hypothetical protein